MSRPGLAPAGVRLAASRLAVAVVAIFAALAPAGPALAEPDAQLLVSGVQTMPGQVRFFLSARGLPADAGLSQVRIDVDGRPLQATVEPIASSASAPESPPRAVVLVFDASLSMAGDALTAAKEAAEEYARGLPADVRLGLVAVSDRPANLLAPTVDRGAFASAAGQMTAHGATALYDGVHQAVELLSSGEYLERRVVVLSDGDDTRSTISPDQLAGELVAQNIAMDVVAFGGQAGGAEVATVASRSGGRLVRAADAAQLRSAVQAMAQALTAPVVVTVDVPAELGGKEVTLHLAVGNGGTDAASASLTATLRSDPRASSVAAARFVGRVLPPWLLVVGYAGIGGALVLGAFTLLYLVLGRSRMRGRLRELENFGTGRVAAPTGLTGQDSSAFMRAALALSERAVQRRNQQTSIESALDRAGITLRPAEWLLVRAVVAIVTAAMLAALLPWPLMGAALGLLVGWGLTGLYRRLRTGRRAARFADLLPEGLQLLVGALRSGFSLAQGIDALVREGPEPVASEFGRALAETRLGGELEEAMERTAARNNSKDLAWLVMAMRIQREVGGNLSEVLETAVETMRERARLRRHVRGLSAEGRLSAYVLTGVPVFLGAWMFISRPEYLRPLYTEPVGIAMLVAAVTMLVLGSFWMSRMIKVEV